MFTVSIWQLLLEIVFMIVLNVKLFFVPTTDSKLAEQLWLNYIHVHFTLVNAFYLLGDNLFLKSVQEVGLLKALLKAICQSY